LAEDGMRVSHVTGVQTCALPIFPQRHGRERTRMQQRRCVRLRSLKVKPVSVPNLTDTQVVSAATRKYKTIRPQTLRQHIDSLGQIGRASCRESVSISRAVTQREA